MSINNPTELVAQFKKSGEFDRLRRELLAQFRSHDSIGTFTSRVHDIIQQRLNEDERLQYLPPEAVHSELMQEMDRFPLVQRTVADLPALSDPTFNASIRRSLARLVKGSSGTDGKQPGQGPAADGDVEMDDSSASESETSDEDHEEEHEHEGEPEPEHEQEREQEDKELPVDMPQNERLRVGPANGDKSKSLVNGIAHDGPATTATDSSKS